MEANRAAEHLQVIRTLMERSALYRRALAPIMTLVGTIGCAAAAAAWLLKIESAAGFVVYWMVVALIGAAGAFLLVRRQAMKSAEPFWSPPTRRVALAMAPPLTAGVLVGILALIASWQMQAADSETGFSHGAGNLILLPALWAVFYGCALHAAGFFTSRGLRLFGWIFILAGFAVFFGLPLWHRGTYPEATWVGSHWLMGTLFGVLHLAYGAYLFLTGAERNPS